MTVQVLDVATPRGPARLLTHPARSREPRATLVLGHGAGGGSTAADLAELAARLPAAGIEVVLVEQPWRVAGKRVAPAPAILDEAWLAAVEHVRDARPADRRLVLGGRSAGARVACRTAADLGAHAVCCLAFPLHPPGRPERTRWTELAAAAAVVPVTVVQGDRDPFGSAAELLAATTASGPAVTTVAIPWADHSFAVPARAPITRAEALAVLVAAVRRACSGMP